MTEFKTIFFHLVTGAASFKFLNAIKQQAQTMQPFRRYHCPNSLTHFHSLLKESYSGLM